MRMTNINFPELNNSTRICSSNSKFETSFMLPKPIGSFSPSPAMAGISEFFSHLYTITLVLFTVLILELMMLVQSVTGFHSRKPKINSTQYLKFIEEKNPTIRYSKRSKLEPNECIVCLSEIEEGEKVRRLKCNHTFHRDCLDEWLQQFWATCPLCRIKVLPDEIVVNFRSQNEVYDGSDEDIMHM